MTEKEKKDHDNTIKNSADAPHLGEISNVQHTQDEISNIPTSIKPTLSSLLYLESNERIIKYNLTSQGNNTLIAKHVPFIASARR